MRGRILNLNEEIKRIKSLFTEERMYGNLNEDDPGCQCDDETKEKYGKYNPQTNECDPDLCESDEETDVKKKSESGVPAGFIELTDSKKNEIEGDETDSIKFYETKEVGGKTYAKRMSFEKIKQKVGYIDKPKPGRDMDYVKRKIKDDKGVPVEIYISKDGELNFMTKKEGKTIRKNIKKDVKQDKGVINDNIDSCREHLKAMYKAWRKGAGPGELEDFGFEADAYKSVERCMANFYNRFEKDDNIFSRIGVGREDIMQMVKSFQDDDLIGDYRSGEGEVSKGVEGEKYTVENARGTKLGVIKKKTGNQYKFNGVRGYTFVEKRNGVLQFKPFVLGPIFKALNLDVDKNKVTVIEGGDNNALFRVK